MLTRRALATITTASVVLAVSSFAGIVSAGTAAGAANKASAPSNDLIGGATNVASLPFTQTLDTTGATTDATDVQANADCGAPATNNSVWYTFTAGATDTSLTVDTTGSDYSSGVIIATGSPGALSTEACGPVSAHVASAPGAHYTIMVFDDTGSGGTLQLSIHGAGPPPANDLISGAVPIGSVPFSDTVDTTGATTDSVDAQLNATCGAPSTGNTVWYKFTAGPNDTNISIDAFASNYNAGIAVATGTPGSLTTQTCSPFSVIATTTPGTTYYIQVFDFAGGGGGTLQLNVTRAPSVKLDVFRQTFVTRAGLAQFKGTYSCTDATSLEIAGSLVEIVGNTVAFGQFDKSIEHLNCDGARHTWKANVVTALGRFAPGNAVAFTSGFACGDVACVQLDKAQVLTLTHTLNSPTIAPVATSATHLSVRSARNTRRNYGTAHHPTTAQWGR